MAPKSTKTRWIIAIAIVIAIALAFGLGLGLGLKKDQSKTALSPPPPSSAGTPPPPPAAVSTFKLASETKLDGLTVASFTDAAKLAYRHGMATTLDVSLDSVSITSVTESSARRRSLLAAGIIVDFEVTITPSAGANADVVTSIVAAVTQKIISTPPATLSVNLQTAFDDAGVSITASVTVQPPVPTASTVTVINGAAVTVTVCGANQKVLNGACINCAVGQTNRAGDDPSKGNTECDAGAPPPPPPSPPPPSPSPGTNYCSTNYHVVSKRCVECDAGTRRKAGDAENGLDTSCVKITCAVNQFVSNHRCESCAPGTTNAYGDVASGANTACVATICDVNYHVSDHKCEPCAPGTTNAYGDDASGANTVCVATICDVNYHVSDHKCEPCAFGQTNEYRDDASGKNTECVSSGESEGVPL